MKKLPGSGTCDAWHGTFRARGDALEFEMADPGISEDPQTKQDASLRVVPGGCLRAD
jgi:hypothetical protein